MSNVPSVAPIENDQPLLDALFALHGFSAALNHLAAGDDAGVSEALRLVVDGVVQLVPGTSALIVLYDGSSGVFDPASKVSSGAANTHLCGARPRESVCFPLVAAGRPLGALHLLFPNERTIGQSALLMVEIFVSHAALALHQARCLAGIPRATVVSIAEWSRRWDAGMPAASRSRDLGCMTLLPASGPGVVTEDAPRSVKEICAVEQAHEQCARWIYGAPFLAGANNDLDALTDREREVLALLAEGMTNKQIAAVLVITPNTVKRHLKAIFEKLGIRTRSAAAAKAISARFPAF